MALPTSNATGAPAGGRTAGQAGSWRAGAIAAGAILAAFWAVMMASLADKSATFDEAGNLAAGYTYWRFHDYRLDPESGNLPQRVVALPLALGRSEFPSREEGSWLGSDVWGLSYDWFYRRGNDAAALLAWGRGFAALFAVALGWLVWRWSSRLFGPAGGLLSLLLFVLNPGVLANGALTTSDVAVSFFFFAATGCLWALLQRATAGRLLLSAAAVAGLFVCKMSAPLIVPVALVLAGARLAGGRPLPVQAGRWNAVVAGRRRQALILAGAAAVHALAIWGAIWGCYGFRYSMFAPRDAGRSRLTVPWETLLEKPDPLFLINEAGLNAAQKQEAEKILKAPGIADMPWAPVRMAAYETISREVLTEPQRRTIERLLGRPAPARLARLADFARRHRLLPEAYLYGQTYTWKFSGRRNAFLNGEVSLTGWKRFFPYAFLVKTPLPVFAIIALAAAAAWTWRRRRADPQARSWTESGWYAALPLWTLFAFYWAAVLMGHLNIGFRHLLPVHAPLFVLCGAAVCWLEGLPGFGSRGAIPARRKAAGWAVVALVGILAAEAWWCFPDYLTYFNAIAGGPDRGYRHLVDSSLDWGQDLPGVRRELERSRPAGAIYLAYFGAASPDYHLGPEAARVRYLFSCPGQDLRAPARIEEFPRDQADARLGEFLKRQPDYEAVGSAQAGDRLGVVLIRKPDALRLQPGTYFISASMLQPVMYDVRGPLGPWNERYEAIYQELRAVVGPLMGDDADARTAALRQHSPLDWQVTLGFFEMTRFARLTAWLRQREPDGNIHHSILIYRLTEADLARALDGPPPELGRDLVREDAGLAR